MQQVSETKLLTLLKWSSFHAWWLRQVEHTVLYMGCQKMEKNGIEITCDRVEWMLCANSHLHRLYDIFCDLRAYARVPIHWKSSQVLMGQAKLHKLNLLTCASFFLCANSGHCVAVTRGLITSINHNIGVTCSWITSIRFQQHSFVCYSASSVPCPLDFVQMYSRNNFLLSSELDKVSWLQSCQQSVTLSPLYYKLQDKR